MGVDVCDVGAPHGVGAVGVELLVQDVVQFLAEVRIGGGGDPWLYPLGMDSQLPHVDTNGALGDTFSFLLELSGDLWSPIVLVRGVIDFLNASFEPILPKFGFRWLVLEEGPIA